MTPKQILDSFSETLMQDERILSAQERALLAALLQHAKASSGESQEMQYGVDRGRLRRSGETVAQRAFTVLGGSIVERILNGNSVSTSESTLTRPAHIYADGKKTEPQPPTPLRSPSVPGTPPEPQPPGVRAPHKDPHQPVRDNPPSPEPQPPGSPHHPPEPQPPGQTPMGDPGEPQPPGVKAPRKVSQSLDRRQASQADVAVVERPQMLPAKYLILDEFLAPQELGELTQFTLEHEGEFSASEVVSPTETGGVINYEHRRSRVLMNLGRIQALVVQRIRAALPQVLKTLAMEEFSIADVEMQVTASNDGDFFHFHSDNGSHRVATRYLTFVYFFHREPRPFEGGELRIHDARLEDGAYVSDGSYQTIVPRQNQIVFFPCELLHEITPVSCPSGQFADSRFTLNGWLRR